MRLYLAGPLFTQAERLWNQTLAQGLRQAGHEVFLPQEAIAELDRLEADPIFELDLNGVRAAEALVAVLDGADPDSGTCFECGVAHALGRPIVAVRTDFRAGGDALPGQTMPTVNLMLSQAVTEAIELVDPKIGPEAVLAAVLAALDRVAQRSGNPRESPLVR